MISEVPCKMAPSVPDPIPCNAPGCNFVTAAECATIAQALQHMSLHVQAAHPAPAAAAGLRTTTKVEHWSRPEINMDTSERDWRFFLDKTSRAKIVYLGFIRGKAPIITLNSL